MQIVPRHSARRSVYLRRWPVAAVLALSMLLTGCSAIRAIHHAIKAVESNRQQVQAFTQTFKSGSATEFEATYTTTGSSPATVVYAVDPPHDVAFSDTPTAAGSPAFELVANATGEYECTPASGATAPSCQKLAKADAATENEIVDLYTPSHWENLLKGGSLVAGLAGDKVSSSTMSVNGFSLNCIDLVAPGVSGTSTICSTQQGILGYAQVASDPTTFEITKYSTSPPASAFALPPGATVTTTPT
jgi:hypothetical protein